SSDVCSSDLFLLQFDQALGLASRGSGTVSLVDLGLHDPVPQSLGIDPELLAHTTERARPRRWIPSRLNSHPRGSFPKLVRVLPRCCHVPHPPVDSEPPPDPGCFYVVSSRCDDVRGGVGHCERSEDLAADVALEAASDLPARLAVA